MRIGRRVAIDVGSKRIGMSICDQDGILASPLGTVADVQSALNLVPSDVIQIYVGLPLNLKGESTASTDLAVTFARQLGSLTDIPISLLDERLTTSMANRQLREIGKSQRAARESIDEMAAIAILESALNHERRYSYAAGVAIQEWDE